MTGRARFLAACAGRPVDRVPVWMMRQAGRYLPEYRAVREKVDFLSLCKTPDLAVEVSLQPLRRFGMDACIVFSDILVPVEAMGAPVEFGDGGPHLSAPIRTMADIRKLRVPDPQERMPFVLETLHKLRRALGEDAALVGFVGAPFTLASYLIEGGSSKNFALTKALMYSDPLTFHALLSKLAETISLYAAAQASAGADAVQIFDTWAGELDCPAYEEFALPYQAAVADRIHARGLPAIVFVNGCAGKLKQLAASGCDVLSIDWRVGLGRVRAELGDDVTLQGNVDPCALLATPQAVSDAARTALDAAGGRGHILNLGHGILPPTSIECARAFVEAPRAQAVPA